jgi:hypothetical protein
MLCRGSTDPRPARANVIETSTEEVRMFRSVVAAVTLVVTAVLASTALAALPTKGAVYEGTLYASGVPALEKKVQVKVAASGKTARVTWWCGVGRSPSSIQFPIKADGTFRAFSNTGSLTVWSFTGKFVSKQKARAALRLNATCDGKGGTVNLLLKA